MPLRTRIANGILPTAQVLLEGLLSILAFLLAYRLWIGPLEPLEYSPALKVAGLEQPAPYLVLVPFILVMRLAMNWYHGLHDRVAPLSLMEDLGRVLRAALMGSVGLICIAFLYRKGFEFRGHSYGTAAPRVTGREAEGRSGGGPQRRRGGTAGDGVVGLLLTPAFYVVIRRFAGPVVPPAA